MYDLWICVLQALAQAISELTGTLQAEQVRTVTLALTWAGVRASGSFQLWLIIHDLSSSLVSSLVLTLSLRVV